MEQKIAINSKFVTSIMLEDDAEKAYNELVKEFGLYKFI